MGTMPHLGLIHSFIAGDRSAANAAISDSQKLASLRNGTLEVGKPEEALASRNGLNASADMLTGESPGICSSGQYVEAIRRRGQGFEHDPKDARQWQFKCRPDARSIGSK